MGCMNNIINIQIIKEFLILNNLKPREFCKKCKISKIAFKNLMKNPGELKISELIRISEFIERSLYELLFCRNLISKIPTFYKL